MVKSPLTVNRAGLSLINLGIVKMSLGPHKRGGYPRGLHLYSFLVSVEGVIVGGKKIFWQFASLRGAWWDWGPDIGFSSLV